MPRILPSEQTFPDVPFVYTPQENFTPANFTRLLKLSNNTKLAEIYQNILPFTTIDAPRVPLYCIYGTDIPTLDKLYFPNGMYGTGCQLLTKNFKKNKD